VSVDVHQSRILQIYNRIQRDIPQNEQVRFLCGGL